MKKDALRIAQVSPLYESVPPKLYGGTERVVFHLSEALIALGHEVTVFASGDSVTSGRLVPTGSHALRFQRSAECLAPHTLMFERVRALADEFDIVHFHTEYMHFGFARTLSVPTVSTLHGRLDFPEYRDLFQEFRDLPMVSISNSQKRPLPKQNWHGPVYHGLPPEVFRFQAKPGNYLAFLGRISPEKGVEEAIEIAMRAGIPLKIAAKIEEKDIDYFHRIKPRLTQKNVEFVGEISELEKSDFIGNASALIFPITWPEPFGLVMIEALATGTPVIAFAQGSVREIIRHGETGYIVESVSEAVSALDKISRIDRALCRADFETRFCSSRMAKNYVDIYREIMAPKICASSQLSFEALTPVLESGAC
jgi:glycosyltransferase involved in cell wall biosynthesis